MKFESTAALTASAWALSACTVFLPNANPTANDRGGRGTLTESPQRVATLTATDLNALAAKGRVAALAGAARCNIDSYRIVYRTLGGAGEAVTSSAAVLVPRGDSAACLGPRPMVMYARGTSFVRDTDISRLEATEPDAVVAATVFAAQGYVVVAPNYVGYAASNSDYHPYYQLEAQASDAIDALLAARASAIQIQLPAASALFLAGYSQGGAVALAPQRALERPDAPPALKVRAVAASAGATMLGDMARTVFAGQPSVGATGFLPLLLTSYQRSYGGLYANPAEVYAPPFGATSGTPGAIPSLPGTLTYPQLLAQGQLPLNLFDRQDGKPFLVQTAFRQAFNSDPQHPLRRAFEANNLDGFKPLAPLLMCHGAKDPLVTVSNTDTVARAYTAKGSTVSRLDLEDTTLPLARAFQAALETAAASSPRAAAYHFVGMPFCQVQARTFFEEQMPR